MVEEHSSQVRALSWLLRHRVLANRRHLLVEGNVPIYETAPERPGKLPKANDLQAGVRIPQVRRLTSPFEPPEAVSPTTGREGRALLRKATGPDLSQPPADDPNATPADICPVGGFDRHSPILMDFARRSKENFALVAMFAPLSAMTPMHFYVVHFLVVAHLLQTYFPKARVSAAEIGGVVTWLTDHLFPPDAKPAAKPKEERRVADGGWKLTAMINGAKYAAIADIWNRRQELYQQYMAALEQIQRATGRTTAAEPNEPLGQDARGRLFDILDGLYHGYTRIEGTGVAKAGFMVQLLTGGLGCIDVHNRLIYDKLADHLIGTGKKAEGRRLKDYLQRLGRLRQDEYKDAVGIISRHGFGSRQLWNAWVDFAASLWDAVAEKDPIYAKIDRVLRTTDFPWHLFQNLRVTKAIPPGNEPWNTLGPGGKPLKQGQTFDLPPVSGTRSGDALSGLHLAPVASGGLSDDPASWRRVQALLARNFDPQGSMARLAQEMPLRYVGAAQGMPSLARLRKYYQDRRRQRQAEAEARAARKAQRNESLALDFKGWFRLQEAAGEAVDQRDAPDGAGSGMLAPQPRSATICGLRSGPAEVVPVAFNRPGRPLVPRCA